MIPVSEPRAAAGWFEEASAARDVREDSDEGLTGGCVERAMS
ncbi:MAG: hypothetical protein ACYDHQ_06945 [Coriobacteriia bacterium]